MTDKQPGRHHFVGLHSSRLEMEWNGMVRSGVVWIGHSICMGPWPSIFKSAQCCAL